jgi:hypothetical protein
MSDVQWGSRRRDLKKSDGDRTLSAPSGKASEEHGRRRKRQWRRRGDKDYMLKKW